MRCLLKLVDSEDHLAHPALKRFRGALERLIVNFNHVADLVHEETGTAPSAERITTFMGSDAVRAGRQFLNGVAQINGRDGSAREDSSVR